jgi:outer membrane receptor protein involved in Fe transport
LAELDVTTIIMRKIVLWMIACCTLACAEPVVVHGRVVDAAGAVIQHALVVVNKAVKTETDDRGGFSLTVPSLPVQVEVSAPGFASTHQIVDSLNVVQVQLTPALQLESVEVTTSRFAQPRSNSAADVVVLDQPALDSTSALALDDVLRQVPGFQLFRRTSSRVANPTSQGASLRGLGPSGASRAKVLVDNIPWNDPFGGWVYWDRIPKLALEQIEVARGGESDSYGPDAIGGVVHLLPVRENTDLFSVEGSGGTRSEFDGEALFSAVRKKWSVSGFGSAFQWGGYIPIGAANRGAVDTPANLRYRTGDIRLRYGADPHRDWFVEGNFFGEERDNGTPLQTNRTASQRALAGGDFEAGGGLAMVRVYSDWQHYHQSFSAIAPDRNSEALTRTQFVPVQRMGVLGQWSRWFDNTAVIAAGADSSWIDGVDDELVFLSGTPQSRVTAGGQQIQTGAFATVSVSPVKRVQLGLGMRFDDWNNGSGFSRRLVLESQALQRTDFADRSESAWSPRVSLAWHAASSVVLSGAAYKSFRPPTLNELYRGFRVGNIMTLPNQALRAEHLNGFEGGADYRWKIFHTAATFFYNELNGAIANTTLTVTPALITRQRQNAGLIRSRGLDLLLEGSYRSVHASAGYEFADSIVQSFPTQSSLVGKRTPQVPRHSWGLNARYERPAWSLGTQLRGSSRQYDDDQNLFPLQGFWTWDLYGQRRIYRSASVFGAVENLLDQRYATGRTPLETLSTPRLARIGLKISWPERK